MIPTLANGPGGYGWGATDLAIMFSEVLLRSASVTAVETSAETAAANWLNWLSSLQLWAIVLTAIGLGLLLPRKGRNGRSAGMLLTAVGLALFVLNLQLGTANTASLLFWILAIVTIGSAVAAITSRNPVYCAIWFALTLLGTAALFLLHGAQFLGVATVVVYAGAIVVTFLFVVMLAQSNGHAQYDRMSWGVASSAMATLAGTGFLAVLLGAVGEMDSIDRSSLREEVSAIVQQFVQRAGDPSELSAAEEASLVRTVRLIRQPRSSRYTLQVGLVDVQRYGQLTKLNSTGPPLAEHFVSQISELAGLELDVEFTLQDVLDSQHMANLGGQLFVRHLIAIEVTGALLLVALVGAIAIAIQGRSFVRQIPLEEVVEDV